jgi:hypothetical protein
VEITLSDLQELGIEWALGEPWTVTKDAVTEDGVTTRLPKTQVKDGNVVNYGQYASDSGGAYALGPQGSFGENRTGNPPTADQGLNFTYQGILTQPMFEAVLHALEIHPIQIVSVHGSQHHLPRPSLVFCGLRTTTRRHPQETREREEHQSMGCTHAHLRSDQVRFSQYPTRHQIPRSR